MCGAAASGNYHWIYNPIASFQGQEQFPPMLGAVDAAKGFAAMILAGPLLTGFTQTINDWYDREIDAINEPNRPIPSGAISEGQVKTQVRRRAETIRSALRARETSCEKRAARNKLRETSCEKQAAKNASA